MLGYKVLFNDLEFGPGAAVAASTALIVEQNPAIVAVLLMISLFPTIAVVAPLYLLLRDIGWLNSYQGLVLAYTALMLPFAIWILRNFFLTIPREMEEVARVDGAGPVRTVIQGNLPQALPGVFTAGVFTFVAAWTEFIIALTLNNEDRYRTPSRPPPWRCSRSRSSCSSSAAPWCPA